MSRMGAVDFLFVDRSFRDLLSIIEQDGNKFIPILARFITLWENPSCARDYLYSNCYKVIANDPKDEVIPDICSLKTGVSMEILENELRNKHL